MLDVKKLLTKILQRQTKMVLIWSGGSYMDGNQTVAIPSGVKWKSLTLVWSEYVNGAPQNYGWIENRLSYDSIAKRNGQGFFFLMASNTFAYIAAKYLYISPTLITGNNNNKTVATASTTGINYMNNHWVLREVWLEEYAE